MLESLKLVTIALAEVEGAIAEGAGFDGSVIEGFARVHGSDTVVHLDPSAFQVLPQRQTRRDTTRMLYNTQLSGGTPSFANPRHILKRALKETADVGFAFYIHLEIEFFLLGQFNPPVPLNDSGYFDHTTLGNGTDFRHDAIIMLEQTGIPVEFSHHEGSPGQHEIGLRYTDVLTMADNTMTLRVVIRGMAVSQDTRATFMPKFLMKHVRSGMHTHMSLFEGDTNIFHDDADEYRLSKTVRQLAAGLLRHAPKITVVTSQWTNSYKHPMGGSEAPTCAYWDCASRSTLIRVPQFLPGKASSAHIEYRTPDPACNPYLAFTLILNAGLAGIGDEYPLSEEVEGAAWRLTRKGRQPVGIGSLPRGLDGALRVMGDSGPAAETLGEHVFGYFMRNKHAELEAYRRQVTPWEIAWHIRVL